MNIIIIIYEEREREAAREKRKKCNKSEAANPAIHFIQVWHLPYIQQYGEQFSGEDMPILSQDSPCKNSLAYEDRLPKILHHTESAQQIYHLRT